MASTLPAESATRPKVALVLAGGGARGAYELGALSVLLPVLEERGERPDIVVGTSVGALNAAFLAATADKPVDEVVEQGCRIWEEVGYDDVLRSLVGPEELAHALRSLADLVGIPGVRAWSLLDPEPLAATLKRLIPIARIRQNVTSGALSAAAVVATSAATGRTVVFHEGGGRPKADRQRDIDYVPTRLGIEHVRASAAIPSIFPAVRVGKPQSARGWYFDGGTHLNTPIKPALALGAEKVIVIALNSLGSGTGSSARPARPDAYDGVSELLQAVLVDPLVHDVHTLTTVNEIVARSEAAAVASAATPAAAPAAAEPVGPEFATEPGTGRTYKRVPYILVAPQTTNAIGECAVRAYQEHYSGVGGAVRSRDLALLGHALDAGLNPVRGELFSYLFFAPEFARELLALGRADAKRWLSRRHDNGPWRLRPLG
jgi:NTE family protein